MRRFPLMLLATALVATALMVGATAADESTGAAPDSSPRCRSGVVLGSEDGKVVRLDLSDLGETINAAVAGLSEALAEIDTIEVFSDGGHRLIVREGGRETEIDVDEIVRETHAALRLAFAEIGDNLDHAEHAHGTSPRQTIRSDIMAERESLRAEISELKEEMEALRNELARLRDQRDR